MKFTKIVYGIAAAYGFISLLPLYFFDRRAAMTPHLQSPIRSSIMDSWA